MEYFSDHWFLWACFFLPAVAWLSAGKLAKRELPLSGVAALVATISGALLAMGAIHVAVDLAFKLAALMMH